MKPPQTPRNSEWIKKRAAKVRLSVEAEKIQVKEGRLTALARLIEEHPIVRLLAVGGIIAALIAFTLDSKGFHPLLPRLTTGMRCNFNKLNIAGFFEAHINTPFIRIAGHHPTSKSFIHFSMSDCLHRVK